MSDTLQKAAKNERLLWLLSNGPALITILGGASITFAASVVTFSELQLLQAIMGLLALIGTSLLTERLIEGRKVRKQMEGFEELLSLALRSLDELKRPGLDALVSFRRDLPTLEARLHGARAIAVSGGSLFRLANEYRALFEQLCASGCKLRFLITDPDTQAVETLSAAVVYESDDADTYRLQIRTAIAGLQGLAARHPNLCEVRLYSTTPSFSLMIVEREIASSVLVEIYPFRLPARDRPMLQLDKNKDPQLHRMFCSQYEAMWASQFAHPCSQPGKNTALSDS